MMFTIEPMVNMGKEDIITDSQNGWEVYTKDHMVQKIFKVQKK